MREPLAVILTSDLSAQVRGRAVTRHEFPSYLDKGCGWVPANLALHAFGSIAEPNPFGSVGDLRLKPDKETVAKVPTKDDSYLDVVLADLVNPDGSPWDCCPRTFLKDAIADLQSETGLTVSSSFEHEFMLIGEPESAISLPFSLWNLITYEPLGSSVLAALEDAGLEPEMWLPEYSPHQWEVTLSPAGALVAADRAILLREIVRSVAARLGHHASFSPILEASGGGNGVHVHLSLWDATGEPVTYDSTRPGNLSTVAGSFAAGILHHAPALLALTASSVVSYERLAPGRWSVGGSFLGENNREALLRICPLFEGPNRDPRKQYNLEFRGADATANPWIVLGSLIRAGLDGIRQQLSAPVVVSGDVSELSPDDLKRSGVCALPTSLQDSLEQLHKNEAVRGWFSERFYDTFLSIKNSEIDYISSLSADDRYAAYGRAY